MSFDTREVLRKLCLSCGVSGSEEAPGQVAAALLRQICKRVECDGYGNVCAVLSEPAQGRLHLLLEAHIDEIGLVVTQVEDGFLRVANCGGVDRRLLLAQQVTIHGREDLPGVIISVPPHLESGAEREKTPELDKIAVDTGLDRETASRLIAPGDKITFYSEFRTLQNGRVSCKAIDDRSGMTAVLYALELLKGKELPCGVSVLFSSQEELGERGAAIGGYRIKPDTAISVDVSFGHTPDAPEHKCGRLGEGPMIGVAPSLSREVTDRLIATAKKEQLPYQLEIMAGETSTDADTIGVQHGGIRTGLVSIPIRYMHTPIETVELCDIEAVGRLLAAYVLSEGGTASC